MLLLNVIPRRATCHRALSWRHYTTVPEPYQILSLDRDRSLFLAIGTGPKQTNRFAFSPEIRYNAFY